MKKIRRLLGTIERMQAITNQTFPFNVVAVLKMANGPKPEKLFAAVNEWHRRHPILGACIKIEKKQFFFQIDPLKEIHLNRIHRKTESTWKRVAEKELNSFVDYINGPLVRISYITQASGDDRPAINSGEIVLTFHHSVMDGVSGGKLLDELLCLLATADPGTSPILPEPEKLYPPAEVFFPDPYKGVRGTIKNFIYFMRMMGDELLYRIQTISSRKQPIYHKGLCKILPCSLSIETSELLLKQAKKAGLTINNLFDAALLKSVHNHLYRNANTAMRFFTFANLRPFLKPPVPAEITGSYFSMLRFTTRMVRDIPLSVLAQNLQKKVYTALKRGDKFCAHLQCASIMKVMLKLDSFRMGTTALSHMGQVNIKAAYGHLKIDELRVFTSNFYLGPEYSAQTRYFNRQFYWDIIYLDSDMDDKQAGEIADDIIQTLESFAKETD